MSDLKVQGYYSKKEHAENVKSVLKDRGYTNVRITEKVLHNGSKREKMYVVKYGKHKRRKK